MTTTLPALSTLPSAQWERIRDGITDLDPVLDSILVWVKNEWLPAQIERATTRYVHAAVYPWTDGANGTTFHVDELPVADRPEPVHDRLRVPVAHVARLHRDRGGPGRPFIGPKIGPYAVPAEMRDRILSYQRGQGFTKQADAVRDLLDDALRAAGY